MNDDNQLTPAQRRAKLKSLVAAEVANSGHSYDDCFRRVAVLHPALTGSEAPDLQQTSERPFAKVRSSVANVGELSASEQFSKLVGEYIRDNPDADYDEAYNSVAASKAGQALLAKMITPQTPVPGMRQFAYGTGNTPPSKFRQGSERGSEHIPTPQDRATGTKPPRERGY